MLVRYAERCAEQSAVRSRGDGLEVQTVERREHGELELEGVVGGNRQRLEVITVVGRQFDGEGLTTISASCEEDAEGSICVPHRS